MKYNAAVITMSDSRSDGSKLDLSGNEVERILQENGWDVVYRTIIKDDFDDIVDELKKCSDELHIPLIITNGGTGFSQRDVTPEATKAVIEKEVPGISEAMRTKSNEITPRGMLSRGVSGIRGYSLIINLPGSPKAVRECLSYVISPIRHGVEVLIGEAKMCGEDNE